MHQARRAQAAVNEYAAHDDARRVQAGDWRVGTVENPRACVYLQPAVGVGALQLMLADMVKDAVEA